MIYVIYMYVIIIRSQRFHTMFNLKYDIKVETNYKHHIIVNLDTNYITHTDID